jgi:DNA-binding protein H-NS
VALKSMSVAELRSLRERVDAAIAEKVAARRHEVQAELSILARVDGHRASHPYRRRGPVAPKYRNPKDASQTWSGRGLQARWLTEAMKSGKKLESFLIK